MYDRTRKSSFQIFVAVLLLFTLVFSLCSCKDNTEKLLKKSTSEIISAVINKDQTAAAELLKEYYAPDEIELMYMELSATLEGVSSFKLKSFKFETVKLDEKNLIILTAQLKTDKGSFDVETHTYTGSSGIAHILINTME